jgi:hypothetical protein
VWAPPTHTHPQELLVLVQFSVDIGNHRGVTNKKMRMFGKSGWRLFCISEKKEKKKQDDDSGANGKKGETCEWKIN